MVEPWRNGTQLLLNVADHGFKAIGFDKDQLKPPTLKNQPAGTTVKVCHTAGNGQSLIFPSGS
jgi:hypothetical protein